MGPLYGLTYPDRTPYNLTTAPDTQEFTHAHLQRTRHSSARVVVFLPWPNRVMLWSHDVYLIVRPSENARNSSPGKSMR